MSAWATSILDGEGNYNVRAFEEPSEPSKPSEPETNIARIFIAAFFSSGWSFLGQNPLRNDEVLGRLPGQFSSMLPTVGPILN